jgi:hypothetical protein
MTIAYDILLYMKTQHEIYIVLEVIRLHNIYIYIYIYIYIWMYIYDSFLKLKIGLQRHWKKTENLSVPKM